MPREPPESTHLGLGRHDACNSVSIYSSIYSRNLVARTLNIGNALLENLLQNLGVLELLLDLANDGLGKLTLLALLNLALVADPGVEDGLGFSSKSGALLELVGLSLELGGLL